jgi:phosphoserine / homoserine phosphotransferase
MNIVCLDLEGVLVPEIWIEVAEKTGIDALKRTTRDEPDYDALMKYRINILKENNLKITDIQRTIAGMHPMDGALDFLNKLRQKTQVIIISDTFEQFAMPLMEKLNYPTIFCNTLIISEEGYIEGYKMRVSETKKTTVKALQALGYDTIASGDSYNDLGMIINSKAGFLFKSTDTIIAANPDIPAFETYDDLMKAIELNL